MILEVVVCCLVLLLALAFYSFVVKPKKLMSFYQKAFQGANFTVRQYPFAPFLASEFLQFVMDERKYHNCTKTLKEVNSEFDVVISNFVDRVLLQLVSPQLAQAYYEADQEKCYRKYELVIGGLRRMVGNGITFSSGEQWKTKRRITTKMLNFTYISSLVPNIAKITKENIEEVIANVQPNEKGFREIDVLELTTKIASTVILQLFFAGGNTKVDDLKIKDQTFNHHIRKLFLLLEEQLKNPFATFLGDKYTKLGITKLDRQLNTMLEDFHQFTRKFVTKRLDQLQLKYQDKKDYPEVYTDLIEAFFVEEILKGKQEITPEFVQSLVDDFGTLYSAGSDTTSHNSHMSIYYTYVNPEVRKQLEQELKDQIPSLSAITYQSFKHCTFLEATLTESLRAYSSANGIFHREAKEDHFLNVKGEKILIKKGTLVMPQTIPTHYKASIYPDPEKFDPHRFIKDGEFVHPEPFTWMNFSAGVRNCIGKQLAWTEMKVILSTLVSEYEMEVVEEGEKMMIFKEFAVNMEGVKFFIKRKGRDD